MRLTSWLLGLAVGAALGGASVSAARASGADGDDNSDVPYATMMDQWNAVDATAPADFGAGPGMGHPRRRHTAARAMTAAATASPSIPTGGSSAGTSGVYGAPITWPIIAIHIALLPDGRVLSYGTDINGNRGAELYVDIWDPTQGTGSSAHTLLPNTTDSDIFCSGFSLQWTSGDLMTIGGDLRPQKKPNNSDNVVTLFNPSANSINETTAMNFPRWYATLVALPNGDFVALGGRQYHANGTLLGAPTPETFDPTTGWTSLTNATSTAAFFTNNGWFYPRAYVAPNGLVFVLTSHGEMYWLDPTGLGTLTDIGPTTGSTDAMPSAMFAPGKILSLRGTNRAFVYDLTSGTPVVTQTGSLSQTRLWSNATVMADGKVLVNGGSSVSNALTGIAYQNETWDPATGVFTLGATATIPRLYHSVALLLADGSVLTGAGGSPGPIRNLNAEIYYPPYLYLNDGSGQPAPRPSLTSAAAAYVGQAITAQVGPNDQISRLTLVKTGATTHAVNIDQRFIELSFNQAGQTLSATLPSNPNILMPGYYMMFAINAAGTPSVASTILVLPQTQGPAQARKVAAAK